MLLIAPIETQRFNIRISTIQQTRFQLYGGEIDLHLQSLSHRRFATNGRKRLFSTREHAKLILDKGLQTICGFRPQIRQPMRKLRRLTLDINSRIE